MPPDLVDVMTGRCVACWLPRPHSVDEHHGYAERVTLGDLADYALGPAARRDDATG
jgi:hypothetical protein